MRETRKCRASPRRTPVGGVGRPGLQCGIQNLLLQLRGEYPSRPVPLRGLAESLAAAAGEGRARRQDGWPGQPGLLRNGVVGKSLARPQNDATLPSYPLRRRARAQDSNCRFRVKWDGTLSFCLQRDRVLDTTAWDPSRLGERNRTNWVPEGVGSISGPMAFATLWGTCRARTCRRAVARTWCLGVFGLAGSRFQTGAKYARAGNSLARSRPRRCPCSIDPCALPSSLHGIPADTWFCPQPSCPAACLAHRSDQRCNLPAAG
jgi:hypothetical protein